MATLVISFDHFQFTLIHGPNIPGSYAILFITASDFTSITHHIHNWAFFFFFSLLCLCLFILSGAILHSSPVAYWAPTDLGAHLSVSYLFAFHTVHGVLKARILSYWDGRVEGQVAIFCKNSKIVTHCWRVIDRRMLDPTKKRYPISRGKGEEAPRLW